MQLHSKKHRTSFYFSRYSTIRFDREIDSGNTQDFCYAIEKFIRSHNQELALDFTSVTKAYPDGMLPILVTVGRLREAGIQIKIYLPGDNNCRRLFRSVNWAHHLDPAQYPISESSHDRHLVTRVFRDAREQKEVVDDFMDVVLRNVKVPRSILAGLEWSINEITDNVLNHSDCSLGGMIQASTFLKNNTIAFAVADAGRGILQSLREGIPTLRTDLQAMGEAVKSGVTRNKKVGQGNGLAGSLKITTLSGGSLEITSGKGKIKATDSHTSRVPFYDCRYNGTVVSGYMKLSPEFSIEKALDFGTGIAYVPVDIIEMQYEMKDQDCYIIHMKDEATGFGTRRSGAQIRTKIFNILDANPTYPLVIDWDGVPLISSSFADEVMGKLFLKMGVITFTARIRNQKMDQLIVSLLDKAVAQRLVQEKDIN
jgi:hypothetical protein